MRSNDRAARTLNKTLALLLLACGIASATEMVYTPVNPMFGGNPNNGPVLLNAAQAQNNRKEKPVVNAVTSTTQSVLQQFNDSLQRSILSQVASAATSKVMGSSGQLVPGTVETGNFRISIVDAGGGMLQIITTDKLSGAMTSFQVSQ